MTVKEMNPKDAIGAKRWRKLWPLPTRVLWEVGVALLEGALKYGMFNYRAAGVRASVYVEAAEGHLGQWKEGENIDPDSGIHHITKAIASLMVLRDGMIHGNWVDDRPVRHDSLDAHRAELQAQVDSLFEKYPEPAEPFTEERARSENGQPMCYICQEPIENDLTLFNGKRVHLECATFTIANRKMGG